MKNKKSHWAGMAGQGRNILCVFPGVFFESLHCFLLFFFFSFLGVKLIWGKSLKLQE